MSCRRLCPCSNACRACPPSAAIGSRLFEDGSAEGRWVVADRGYTSHAFRQHVWDLGARPAIPQQRHESPLACPGWIYHNRHRVERLWARLKEWRAIATRYEKTARSFMGVLCLAATLDWLRR
jgi:transposase